jgi:hypothetical protein
MAKQPANQGDSQITTLEDEAPAQAAPAQAVVAAIQVAPANKTSDLCGRKATIIVQPGNGDDGNDAVFVSLNSYAWQIPRSTPVEVPVEVLEILQNAKQTTYFKQGKELVSRDVYRHNFQVVSIDPVPAPQQLAA